MDKSKPFQQTQGQRPSVDDLAELRSVGQRGHGYNQTASEGRLKYVLIGRQLFIPKAAIARFIATNPVRSSSP
jgi:hypothetical protein